MIVVLNIIAAIFFLCSALYLIINDKKNYKSGSVIASLLFCIFLYLFVTVSNALEHSGITDFFDPAEDIAEVLFCLVFLFFANTWRTNETLNLIKSQSEHLAITLKSINDCVIATDKDGRINMMNSAAEQVTGWKQDEAQGKDINSVVNLINSKSKVTVENPILGTLQSGKIVNYLYDITLISKMDIEYRIVMSCAPIRYSLEEITGAIIVFRNITEEINLLERLHHFEKLDAVGQLAGGIAHDFNNMLGGIIGATQILEKKIADNPEAKKYIKLILEASDRASHLVKQLLTFGRKQESVKKEMNIFKPLKDALDLLKNTIDPRINILTNLSSEEIIISGDPALLQSAFLNILINAAQAMPDGGNIDVTLKKTEIDSYYCNASPFKINPGNFCKIEITDSGCGIASENLNKIFEPFYTTKGVGKGTGLGLAAVYGAVQQHGGAINVYSEIGKGTRFCILLPVVSAEREIKIQINTDEIRGNNTILLVDDESIMRVIAGDILEDLGYRVYIAENGKEAVHMFRNIYQEVDLVILDMIMPVMNGRDCMVELKKIRPDIPVIFASGFIQNDLIEEFSNQVQGFIPKPYNQFDLSKIVYDALHKQ